MSQQGSGGDEERAEVADQDHGIPSTSAFGRGMPWLQMGLPRKLQMQLGRRAASLLLIDKLLIFRVTPNRGYTHLALWKNQVKLSSYLIQIKIEKEIRSALFQKTLGHYSSFGLET